MSLKKKEDAVLFLLDEFFINKGLEDIENNSINQYNELESMMLKCHQILKDIYKIQSNINIAEKENQMNNPPSIKKYLYIPNNEYKKNSHKMGKNISKNKINKTSYMRNTGNGLKNKNIRRNSFGYFESSIEKKSLKRININPLIPKNNKNKISNIFYNKNAKISNLKKQLSQYSQKNRLIESKKNSLSSKDIKKKNRRSEKYKNKKINIRHFTISLMD